MTNFRRKGHLINCNLSRNRQLFLIVKFFIMVNFLLMDNFVVIVILLEQTYYS